MPSGKSSRRRTQRDQMFIALQNYIENESFDYLFVVGDFNVTLSRLDSSSSLVKSVDYFSLKTLLQQNNLKDSFRIFNPQSKIFSYIRSNAASRLDRIYIPATIQHKQISSKYVPLTFSDHSFGPLIQIEFNSTLKLRPESLWKLNDSLLSADLNKTRFNFFLQKWLGKRSRFENP